MRFALVLHFFAAAACALRPVPVVQRRALLGGGAAFVASGVRSCKTDAGRALHGVDAVETTQVATTARRNADAAGLDDSLHSLGLDGSGHSSGSGHSFGLDHSGHSLGLSGLAPDAMDASIHAPRHFLFADLAAGGEADDEPPSI